MKLLPAVAGGELLKIDGGRAVGDVGNAGVCISKHLTDRIAHIPKVTTFGPHLGVDHGVDPATNACAVCVS